MNIFALLVGGIVAKRLTDYPSEIRNLKDQIPKSDRETFLNQYKKLSNKDKTSFKQALRNADLGAASQVLGQDLSRYQIVLKKRAAVDNREVAASPPSGTDIVAKVNKLLAVPTSIDPELVAEAARRYEEAVPSTSNLSIAEKTKRLIEVSG